MANFFNEIGLPEAPSTLAYHEPSRTLIAHVGSHNELPHRKRLYFRWTTDVRYQLVAAFPDNISIDSFALDPSRRSLCFVTNEWTPVPGRKAATGNWDALYQFDLHEHRSEQLTRRGGLPTPNGYEKSWLRTILSVGSTGRSIFCMAGLQRQGCVEYWICELDLTAMQLTPMTRLQSAFA